VLGISSEDVVMAAPPFFHVYGLQVILNFALQVGATVVTMARFDFEQFLTSRPTRGYASRSGAAGGRARRA
jgi:acyl-CoA synthetase (AMP-forming)/AMP-acid ligase II